MSVRKTASILLAAGVSAALVTGPLGPSASAQPPDEASSGFGAAAPIAAAPPSSAGLQAKHSLRSPVTDENFYFVMADRFANGDPDNNTGGIPGDRLQHGYDPTHRGFYNGGDLAGLLDKIDYIQGLGTTSIWLTPSFKNKAVQLEDGPVGRLPRLLDHRLHPDRPTPGHECRAEGAGRRGA